MTTRPIIFSTEMVRALLEGRKTQTRRLASSPLRRVEVGDLLWVKEQYRLDHVWNAAKPSNVPAPNAVMFPADGFQNDEFFPHGKLRTARFMPRWASRLTLKVTRVRYDPLQNISGEDCLAEGVYLDVWKSVIPSLIDPEDAALHPPHTPVYFAPGDDSEHCIKFKPQDAFAWLWDTLHDKPGERWADNPAIVALTFRVHRCNVDAFPSLAQADSPEAVSGASDA